MSSWASEILALTDALGNLVHFVLLPGRNYDTVGVAPLIQDIDFDGLIADKAFDVHWIAEEMRARRAHSVIPQRKNRLERRPLDRSIYQWRHLIENFFGKLKEFKRIVVRSEKTDQSFSAMVYLAAATINSR